MEDQNTSQKPQVDTTGDVNLPEQISIKHLIRSRIDEIEALTKLIESPNKNYVFAKKFPAHMRRRAMSHNIKRFPTRMREEMMNKKGLALDLKRPRRKYRRRPCNLLQDYNRRQRKFVWLETHIWHAKRFHMIEKWGYKLPNFPNDKSYRACYRATAKHCLIQDISYYCCIELSGQLHDLLNGLKSHISGDCGLTFSSTHIQSGQYEGKIFFYSSNSYPRGGIGEVKYFWQPPDLSINRNKLWLWCHPSFYSEVIHELIKTFNLELEERMSIEDEILQPEGCKVEQAKLLTKNVPFFKAPKYNSSNSSITMILLKDTLNRFCLTGPLSQSVVTKAFSPVDFSKRTVGDWAVKYYTDRKDNCWELQKEFWQKMKKISNPGQLPRHMILSSVVIDPRFTLPAHRKKIEDPIIDMEDQLIISPDPKLSWSPIWQSEVRDEIASKKLSTHELNQMRMNKVVPGLEIEAVDTNIHDKPAIPILLIQNPGGDSESKPLGYGSGWDIIVPSGYGHPVWLGLFLHGGRAGGLKESVSILREKGQLGSPPDTNAGIQEEDLKRTEETETFFRLPPAKRFNYIKLGIPTPFYSPWKLLVHDWTGSETFHVLRDKNILISLKNKLKNIKQLMSFEIKEKDALVPVRLTFKDKGTLTKNAHICIPTQEDLTELQKNKKYSGPIEPQHDDINEEKRKKIRAEHKTLLKSLARKRRKDKKYKRETDSNSSEPIVEKQKEIMRDLWLPNCDTIKNFCSRTIMGFVTDGDFSFTSAKTCGVGYVVLQGLLEMFSLLENSETQLFCTLVRSTNSAHFRLKLWEFVLCFAGEDLVSWLLGEGLVKDREEGVVYGGHLLSGRLIRRLAGPSSHQFTDDAALFTFSD